MARNVEIKAHVADRAALARKVAAIADSGPVGIEQDDTFFRCSDGRLKLRRFSDRDAELIFYRRADRKEPGESFYLRTAIPDAETLGQSLALAWGECGRVRKHRSLYLAGRTRIHLDVVEDLGDFLELEVVLAEDEPRAAGLEEARRLMQRLEIDPGQLIERAYIDLLTETEGS